MANSIIVQNVRKLLVSDYDQWELAQYGPHKSVVYKGIAIWDGMDDESSEEVSRLFSTMEQAEEWCHNYTFSDYQAMRGGCEVWVEECKVY